MVRQHGQEKLTPRQRQVLAHLLGGDGEKQVAYRLKISVHTVHAHVRRIYRVFQVHSQNELLARFIQHSDGESTSGRKPLILTTRWGIGADARPHDDMVMDEELSAASSLGG